MALSIMVIPTIEICLASPPITPVEPFSPIPPAPVSDLEEEGLRSSLLSPPKHLSPLCPADVPLKAHQGLERERFEALLRASRDRSKALGNKKEPSLRKELAQKNHISKQAERRNRFLQKLQEPPSPLAVNDPKTPPESPAILNYSLPSPGLQSPLAMLEQLEEECASPRSWVEQVDYRLRVPAEKKSSPTVADKVRATLFKRSTPNKGLPSLDEITARMTMRRAAPSSKSSTQEASQPRLNVGRLQIPPRSPSPQKEDVYNSPTSPASPALDVITTIVPPMFTNEKKKNLTRSNVEAFSREHMLTTLRRRSDVGTPLKVDLIRDLRRRSAPAELPKRERQEFKHPVLNLRGAF